MLKLLLLLPIVAFFVVFGILGISKHIVIAILFLSIAACIFILFCILLGVSIYKKSVTKNGVVFLEVMLKWEMKTFTIDKFIICEKNTKK